jgi:DNA helicase-2/ATP-dependent DNA helicase PcrA
MKKSELKVGNLYTVQTDDDQIDVRLTEINDTGRYYKCVRLDNKRTLVVRYLRDFLYHVSVPEIPPDAGVASWVEPTLPSFPVPKDVFQGNGPGSGLVPNKDQFPRATTLSAVAGKEAAAQVVETITSPQNKGFAARMKEQVERVPGCSGPHLIIRARAGTGKTTTMIEGLKELKQVWLCPACSGIGRRMETFAEKYGSPSTPPCQLCGGTGKGHRLTPSLQQQAVWDSISLSRDATTVCMVAFNKSIAEELKRRVPPGVDTKTIHSMGYSAVKSAFPLAGFKEDRLKTVIGEVVSEKYPTVKGYLESFWIFRKAEPTVASAVLRLASLCKLNLIPMSEDDAEDAEERMHRDAILVELADYHGIELEDDDGTDHTARICELIPKVITFCRNVEHDNEFDHDDMVWLPIVRGLPVYKYDLLFVDEAQDLNRCQQTLVKMAGHRLVFCGDDRQAIYGFAGSDAESIATLFSDMSRHPRGCEVLPLTVTRRCGRAIVEEAKRYVPDFEAHESNGEGRVYSLPYGTNGNPVQGTYHSQVRPGDMIICRVTAPLVFQCLKFINRGQYATIQGRDIVSGLRSLAEKLAANGGRLEITPGGFLVRLQEWQDREEAKERNKLVPSMSKLLSIQDRAACLRGFYLTYTGAENPVYPMPGTGTADFLQSIDAIFSEQAGARAIRLSTIHKAKGLEADRVFFLMPDRAECPHPLAKKPWQREQEFNLLYVGITRAREELVFVS